MVDRFEGHRKIPHLRVPYNLLRSKTFIGWNKTPESAVWGFLVSYIIRSEVYTGKVNIYNEFWKNGILASKWSLEDIAKRLGYAPNSGAVQKLVKKLHTQKLLKIHKSRIGRSEVNIYELGIHDFIGNDTIHALVLFDKIAREEDLGRWFTMPERHSEQ